MTVLALAAGCGQDSGTTGSTPASPVTEPTSGEPTATGAGAVGSAGDVSLTTLPTDVAVVTRSGQSSLKAPIAGTFGPDYVLYARCRGAGLRVEVTGSDPWDVSCDGVPARLRMLTESKATSLRLTTTPGTHWTFIVAKEKQPAN
ncbi:hypothetical protein [Kribbella solani]|uniref:Uncharacterized protein n=1 Tax=Kribbella solani TaxID=236067 RepID=A0A841DVA1_9ACTN|nr:hypothetical protein [Kribbella solani]MBB5980686.1 hypothetical protein [Kribbella solani]MDX2967636.1 hypothetical protein [Kribbella solani]MDX3002568.1 hypothetical protein [Kribbella solani]